MSIYRAWWADGTSNIIIIIAVVTTVVTTVVVVVVVVELSSSSSSCRVVGCAGSMCSIQGVKLYAKGVALTSASRSAVWGDLRRTANERASERAATATADARETAAAARRCDEPGRASDARVTLS